MGRVTWGADGAAKRVLVGGHGFIHRGSFACQRAWVVCRWCLDCVCGTRKMPPRGQAGELGPGGEVGLKCGFEGVTPGVIAVVQQVKVALNLFGQVAATVGLNLAKAINLAIPAVWPARTRALMGRCGVEDGHSQFGQQRVVMITFQTDDRFKLH
jgi:hypothetical protein